LTRFGSASAELDLGSAGKLEFDGVKFNWGSEAAARPFRRPSPRRGRESFDAAKVGPTVRLRHWQPGDRFQPIGMKHPVKLQDLFTNAKIPQTRRRALIVAETSKGTIFWVEGLRIGEQFKLAPRTRFKLIWQWRRHRVEA
jgi:tRNA(Ile)-lysidine synthetase-like protein